MKVRRKNVCFSIATLMLIGSHTSSTFAQIHHSHEQVQLILAVEGCSGKESENLLYSLHDGDRVAKLNLDDSFNANSLRKAELERRQILLRDQSDLDVRLDLAEILTRLGSEKPSAYDEAMTIYRDVIAKDSTGNLMPIAQLGIGNVFALKQRYSDAIAQYKQVIQGNRGNSEIVSKAYGNMGAVLAQTCQYSPAIDAYKASVAAIWQPYTQDLYKLTELLRQEKRLAEAVPIYQKLVRSRPQEVMIIDDLAQILVELERFAEAEALCRDRLRLKDQFNSFETLMILGDALQGQGNPQEALRSYQTASEVYAPKEAIEIRDLDIKLRERGLPDLAIKVLQKSLNIQPSNLFLLQRVGALWV